MSGYDNTLQREQAHIEGGPGPSISLFIVTPGHMHMTLLLLLLTLSLWKKAWLLVSVNLKQSLQKTNTTLYFSEDWLFTKYLTSTWKGRGGWIQTVPEQPRSRACC